MSRRSRNKSGNGKSNLVIYIIIGAAVLGALIAGKIFLDRRAQHFANTTELPVKEYKQNANALSGNEYRVTGKIVEKLKWTPDSGQLISLYVDQGENGSGTIGIKVPSNLKQVNLERGQTYTFKIAVNREGLPVAIDVKAE